MLIEKSDFIKNYPSLVMVCDYILQSSTPPMAISKLLPDDILVFYYTYDDKTADIDSIVEWDVIEKITLSIYKKTSASLPRKYAAFMRFPLDTQNALNYQILRHLSRKSDDAKKELKALYKEAQKQDIKRAKKIAEETNYKNTFDIYDRNSFVRAINNYLYVPEKIKSIVFSITDTLAGYLKANQDKNLYGGMISRAVTLLPDFNGGIIKDGNYFSDVRYLFGGVKSSLVGVAPEDSELYKKRDEAVKLYRENVSIKDIYIQTGWFYNKFDAKWRFLIPDNEAKLTTWSETFNIFAVRGSRAEGMEYEAFTNIARGDTGYCKKLLDDGWDCKLSDVLDHPILYKHYEQLFSLPIFFIHTTATTNYFYNPTDKFILICGDPKQDNLRSILLHEIQHAIQDIEGFGSGGNLHFAKIVSSIGGDGLREFLGALKNGKDRFEVQWNKDGRYSYESFKGFFGSNVMTESDYYDDSTRTFYWLVNNRRSPQVGLFLSDSLIEGDIDTIIEISKKSQSAIGKLKAQGYSDNQINGILFSNYELLLGELESRNVQELENFDEYEAGYFMPLSTEGYDEARIVVHTNSYGEVITMPASTKAAIERTMGKYIFHLKQGNDIKPFLHELAHLVYDIIDPDFVNNIINHTMDLAMLKKYNYSREEIFCDLVLCYFASLEIDDGFTKRVIPNQELMGFEMDFVPKLNQMFQGENTSNTLKTLSQMNYFVTNLLTETL
jgi:hypothetical protein